MRIEEVFEEPAPDTRADGVAGAARRGSVVVGDGTGPVAAGALPVGGAQPVVPLRQVLDSLPQRVFWMDRSGRVLGCNRAYAEDRDSGASEAEWVNDLQGVESGNIRLDRDEARTMSDGTRRWVRGTSAPLVDESGRLVGHVVSEEDVTARKEVELGLQESSNLLDTLLENTPDYIYFKDRESRFVRYSHKFLRLLGLTDPDALKGKCDSDLFTDEHAEDAYTDERRIIETGRPLIGKLEKETHVDGHVSWVLTTKLPWRDKSGEIVGTFGISKDVTALKEAEAELEQTHLRLVEASRLAGMAEVATDVLHNVGNVLNSINVTCTLMADHAKTSKVAGLARISELLAEQGEGLAEFLTNDPRGIRVPAYLTALSEHLASERQTLTDHLERLLRHVDHIKQIVEMQQSYAKVAGIIEPVSPRQVIDDALAINGAALARHRIEARVEMEDIPEIVTDKHKILQILVNLIRNAKYAVDEAGGSDRSIVLKVTNREEDTICIQVADTGVGITEENLTRIFSHGFTTRRGRGGHGFGLHSGALAAKELHGSLVAHSDGPGKGAVFTLTLPKVQPGNAGRHLGPSSDKAPPDDARTGC